MPTRLNRDLFTEEGWKVVNDYSLRHDVFRPFYSPGPLFQKGFDAIKFGDIIHGPNLHHHSRNHTTLYKFTSGNEFNAIDPEKNEPTRIDIKIKGWSLFKVKGGYAFSFNNFFFFQFFLL